MPLHFLSARRLADLLLAADWTRGALDTLLRALPGGFRPQARAALLRQLLAQGETWRRRPPQVLAAKLLLTAWFRKAPDDTPPLPPVLESPLFAPAPRLEGLDIPRLATLGELCVWLGVTRAELDWFADLRRTHGRAQTRALQHYDYAIVPKRSGGVRLLEAPKPRLKALQRKILRAILDPVPVHPAAFGFVSGRNCIAGAARHCGEAMVVTADLRDFFLTAPMGRVYGLFRALGYPHRVAEALTRLCGTQTPRAVWERLPEPARRDFQARRRFAQLHLPQGAPTSPKLANLVAFQLDVRLAGLARRRDAAYSRYADDLAFSGDGIFAEKTEEFVALLSRIAREEGFELNVKKTRFMPASTRQRVTGIVVNDHVNVPREDYDRLKAILHNCARNGPAHENREAHPDFRAHLEGRVTWVETLDRARGAKLRAMFERIGWEG